MEGNVYRKSFFAGTRQTRMAIKKLKSEYAYVQEQTYELQSPAHGDFALTVVWYASPWSDVDDE